MCKFICVQAEDGIRDLVRSRGLGDVYKRQDNTSSNYDKTFNKEHADQQNKLPVAQAKDLSLVAVSYTHLTLPTSDLV